MEWVQSTTEYIFQFDLKNEKDWDDYQVVHGDDAVQGTSHKCTQRIPKIFKRLCVAFDDAKGFKLDFQNAPNVNAEHESTYSDLLWYYGDHESAQNAEKVAQAKYVDFDAQVKHVEIVPSFGLRRGLLSPEQKSKLAKLLDARKCFEYGGAKACAHVDPSHSHLMTVSVGLEDDDEESGHEFAALLEDDDALLEEEDELYDEDDIDDLLYADDMDDMDDVDDMDAYYDDDDDDDFLDDMDDAYYYGDDDDDYDDAYGDYDMDDMSDLYKNFLAAKRSVYPQQNIPSADMINAALQELQNMKTYYDEDYAYEDDDYTYDDEDEDYASAYDDDDDGDDDAYANANAYEDDYGDSMYEEEYEDATAFDEEYEDAYLAEEIAEILSRAEQEENAQIVDDENGDHFFEEDDADIIQQKAFVANAVQTQSNDAQYVYEYEEDAEADDESALNLQDKWISDDGEAWMISTQAVDDFDEEWDNDDEWDEITPSVMTVHGHQITRKCMHMWGHRLCLCQFLNWIDGRKYKCVPTSGFYTGGGGGYMGGDEDNGAGTIGGGGNIGLLPNHRLNAAGTYSTYHSYGSPDITHHEMIQHDPNKVKYEEIHMVPEHHQHTQIEHEIHFHVKSNEHHSDAAQEELNDYDYDSAAYDDDDGGEYDAGKDYYDEEQEQEEEQEEEATVAMSDEDDEDDDSDYYQAQDQGQQISNAYAQDEVQLYLDEDYGSEGAYDDASENIAYDDAYGDDSYGDAADDDYGYDAFYADAVNAFDAYDDEDDDEAVADSDNDDYDYDYERESNSDGDFAQYFDGNSNMEQQNGDMQPDIFWTMMQTAVLCGVVFCFCAVCYCCKKRQKRYSFMRIENKMTDFDESATEYSFASRDVRKHVRKPANAAQPQPPVQLPQQADHQAQVKDHAEESQSANESSASSNDEYNESDDERCSKKHRDIIIQEYQP
eukprot:CAMPEP_0202691126 /NCGR_PEP_ID=MMETSP1385-20130828/5922_1 /ASSEMBLY_ACC=CAM_ASM_000861 /TAXON_ID=933848 /ORGANISM="Elphidium margaritaceum" /LENGTH=941 /DNA_ID=CAMNT_0049346481 /DNA_START=123 /DNA_END=2948 /DNA_ORIENTATION=+